MAYTASLSILFLKNHKNKLSNMFMEFDLSKWLRLCAHILFSPADAIHAELCWLRKEILSNGNKFLTWRNPTWSNQTTQMFVVHLLKKGNWFTRCVHGRPVARHTNNDLDSSYTGRILFRPSHKQGSYAMLNMNFQTWRMTYPGWIQAV